MKPQRPPFQPLTEDMDDRLERLAKEKGVGALVRPDQEEKGAQAPAPVAAALDKPVRVKPTPRSRMKTVNLELPDYVWTELKIRAAHRQTSVRHIVIAALRKDGFTIAEPDMIEDGRRIRGKVRDGSQQ